VFKPAVSINELMVRWIDNAAHVLWDGEKVDFAPKNEADWIELEDHATQLAAAGGIARARTSSARVSKCAATPPRSDYAPSEDRLRFQTTSFQIATRKLGRRCGQLSAGTAKLVRNKETGQPGLQTTSRSRISCSWAYCVEQEAATSDKPGRSRSRS